MKMIKFSLIAGVLLATGIAPLQAEQIQGKVLKVEGTAQVNIPGKGTQDLVAGTLVPAGSEITTSEGSSVMVGLTSGAGVVVEENSQLELETLNVEKSGEKLTKREIQVNLKNDAGSAISFLKDFDGVTDYKVKTTNGVAAARGTVWRTTQASVQVISGNVQVVTIAGVTVTVPAGSAYTDGQGVTTLTQAALDAITEAVEAAGGDVTPAGPGGAGPTLNTPGQQPVTLDEVNSQDQ